MPSQSAEPEKCHRAVHESGVAYFCKLPLNHGGKCAAHSTPAAPAEILGTWKGTQGHKSLCAYVIETNGSCTCGWLAYCNRNRPVAAPPPQPTKEVECRCWCGRECGCPCHDGSKPPLHKWEPQSTDEQPKTTIDRANRLAERIWRELLDDDRRDINKIRYLCLIYLALERECAGGAIAEPSDERAAFEKFAKEWLDVEREKEALAVSDWIREAEAYCKHLPELLAKFARASLERKEGK